MALPNFRENGSPTSVSGSADSSGSESDRLRLAARHQVALVEGSSPHLSAETRDLLRGRLRIVAVLFFIGFLALTIRWLFYWDEWGLPEHRWLFYIQCIVAALLGAASVKLCRRCAISLTHLRIGELLVFGCPAVFFFLIGYHKSAEYASLPGGRAYLPELSTLWILLIFTYAMFVPNTWRRALSVMAPMAVAPLVVLALLDLARACVSGPRQVAAV